MMRNVDFGNGNGNANGNNNAKYLRPVCPMGWPLYTPPCRK